MRHYAALPHAKVCGAIQTVQMLGAYPAKVLAFEFLVLMVCRTEDVRRVRVREVSESRLIGIPFDQGGPLTWPTAGIEARGGANPGRNQWALLGALSTSRCSTRTIRKRADTELQARIRLSKCGHER